MTPTASSNSQLFEFFSGFDSARFSMLIGEVRKAWVAVGVRLGVKVGLGNGVSVGGRGVKVAVAGGVTCSSFSPG